jgi:AmiR/NasT family two-component response regulator
MKVAALIDDLFFVGKVRGVAQELGTELTICRSADAVPADVDRVFVDLNASTFDPVAEISRLSVRVSRPVIAFVSHVQVELKNRAEQAGATEVLARSAFVQRLPELLRI